MVDKVKPLKYENAIDGTEVDVHPTETNPTEDYLATKGIAFENSNERLIDLDIDGNIQIKDATHSTPVTIKSITEKSSDMSEPTGFINRTDSVIAFNEGTRTFSIAPSVTEFSVYVAANKITISTTLTKQIPNTSGAYYFFIDETGALDYLTTFDLSLMTSKAYAAYVMWDAAAGASLSFGEERHGITMDSATHRYLHTTRGTQLISGASIGFTTGDGSSDTHAKISISDAIISDEDIVVNIANSASPSAAFQQKLSSVAEIPVYYRVGTAWKKDAATEYPLKQGTSRIKYNKNTAGVWSAEDVSTNGYFAVYYIFATTNINEPIIAIMGQDEYVDHTDVDARSGWYSLNFGDLPAQEMKLLYSVMFQTSSAFSNTPKALLSHVHDLRFGIDREVSATSLNTDHGNLSGLSNDDHPQYLPVSGSRPMTGNLDMGSHNVNNAGTVNGVTVENHKSRHQTGGADAIPVVTTSVDGLMSATDKTKLNSVEQRANHTGTQLATTISDFAATVLATLLTGISFATGTAVVSTDSVLIAIGKLQAQITSNASAIALRALASITVSAGTGLSGGGDLTADRTISMPNTGTAGTYGAADSYNSVTTDAQGRVTGIVTSVISIIASQVSNFASTTRSVVLSGISFASAVDVVATDTILAAFGKLQAKFTEAYTSVTPENIGSTNVAGTSTALARADHVHASTGAVNGSVGSATNTTTTSTTFVTNTSLNVTPVAGTYVVIAGMGLTHGSNNADVFIAIYTGTTQSANSQRNCRPRTNNQNNNMEITTHAIVTVNGSEEISCKWRTTTGTATASVRSLDYFKIA